MKYIQFPPSDIHMSKEYALGRYQYDAIDKALEYVKNFQMAVDGGAFIGMISIHLAEKFDEVIAFEPAHDTFDCLSQNTEKYSNITCINSALGNENKQCSLGQDQVHEGNTGGRYVQEGDDCIITKLGDYTFEALDFIKLDVEGYELEALRGAKDIIRYFEPVILCEEKPRLMERQGFEKNVVTNFLSELGYKQVARVRRDYVYTKN